MVSPTIGRHAVCTIQDAAGRIGFGVGTRDPRCDQYTALDGRNAPPEHAGASGDEQAAGVSRAGVASVDASWHIGASGGQFSGTEPPISEDSFDPHHHSDEEDELRGPRFAGERARARGRRRRRREGRDRQPRPLPAAGPPYPQDRRSGRAANRHPGRERDGHRLAQPQLALLLDARLGHVDLPGRLRPALLRVHGAEGGGRGHASERWLGAGADGRRRPRRSTRSPVAHLRSPDRRRRNARRSAIRPHDRRAHRRRVRRHLEARAAHPSGHLDRLRRPPRVDVGLRPDQRRHRRTPPRASSTARSAG